MWRTIAFFQAKDKSIGAGAELRYSNAQGWQHTFSQYVVYTIT